MNRLLIIFSRIGDLTLATPLLRCLSATGSLSLLTRSFGEALFCQEPTIHTVYTLKHPNLGKRGAFKWLLGWPRVALSRRLKKRSFDEILMFKDESAVIKTWVYRTFPSARIREMEKPRHVHEIEAYRQACASIGADLFHYEPIPRLTVTLAQEARATRFMASFSSPVIGIQLGSQRTATSVWFKKSKPNLKGLSSTQWRAFLSRLLQQYPTATLLFHGSPAEYDLVHAQIHELPQALQSRCYNASDKVPLSFLPAVLKAQSAMISVDTGSAHIAAAVGCPLLVFFGPSDPKQYQMIGEKPVVVVQGRANCMPCMQDNLRYKQCQDNICLNRLTEDELWQGWLRLRCV